MNQNDFVEFMRLNKNVNPTTTRKVLAGVNEAVASTLRRGGTVSLNFATFNVVLHKERTITSVRNGALIDVPPSKKIKIKVSGRLEKKADLN